MTPSELLCDLAERGIVLKADEGYLRYRPKASVTRDLEAMMREHKTELLTLLADSSIPTKWDQYADAIADAFANPSTREEIGPLWMTDPDGFRPCEFRSLGGLCSPPRSTIRTPGVCDRCGSDQYTDILIHNGRSIRRDCSKCGRFLDFPRWNPGENR